MEEIANLPSIQKAYTKGAFPRGAGNTYFVCGGSNVSKRIVVCLVLIASVCAISPVSASTKTVHPDVSLKITYSPLDDNANGVIEVGDRLHFQIQVYLNKDSLAPAVGVYVTSLNPWPDQTQFITSSLRTSQGKIYLPRLTSGENPYIRTDIGPLKAGSVVTISYDALIISTPKYGIQHEARAYLANKEFLALDETDPIYIGYGTDLLVRSAVLGDSPAFPGKQLKIYFSEFLGGDYVLTETVPAHTTFVPQTGDRRTSSNWKCENGGKAGSICTYKAVPYWGTSFTDLLFTLQVDFPLNTSETVITNVVQVGRPGWQLPDPNPSNDIFTQTIPLFGYAFDSALTVSFVEDPNSNHEIDSGDVLAYTYVVTNTGKQPAENLEMVGNCGQYMEVDAKSLNSSKGDARLTNYGYCITRISALEPDEVVTMTFTAKAEDYFPPDFTEYIKYAQIRQNGAYLAESNRVNLRVANQPDVTLEQAPINNAAPFVSGTVPIKFRYANQGNYNAFNVIITAEIPALTSLDAQVSDSRWKCANSVCAYAFDRPLQAGANGEIEFALRLPDPLPSEMDTLPIEAAISMDDKYAPDHHPENNAVNTILRIGEPPALVSTTSAQFAYDANGDNEISVGDVVTVTTLITNTSLRNANIVTAVASSGSWMTILPNSIQSSQGFVSVNSPSYFEVDVSPILAGDTVTATWLVELTQTLPHPLTEILLSADIFEPTYAQIFRSKSVKLVVINAK